MRITALILLLILLDACASRVCDTRLTPINASPTESRGQTPALRGHTAPGSHAP